MFPTVVWPNLSSHFISQGERLNFHHKGCMRTAVSLAVSCWLLSSLIFPAAEMSHPSLKHRSLNKFPNANDLWKTSKAQQVIATAQKTWLSGISRILQNIHCHNAIMAICVCTSGIYDDIGGIAAAACHALSFLL